SSMLTAIKNNEVEVDDIDSFQEFVRNDIIATKMYLSPRVSKNPREDLIAIGIDEKLLPMTSMERAQVSDMDTGRYMTQEQFDALLNDPSVEADIMANPRMDMNAYNQLDEDSKRYERIKHVIANR